MNERLTDEEVAAFVNDRWYNALTKTNESTVVARLAREVQERRGQRCETCEWFDGRWCTAPHLGFRVVQPEWFCASWETRK